MYILLFSLLATSFADTPACDRALAGIAFDAPGLHLYPATIVPDQARLDHEQVRSLNAPWRYDGAPHAEPLAVTEVPNRAEFSHAGAPNVVNLPIKFPGTAYALPAELAQFRRTLQRLIDFEHHVNPRADAESYAYLTIEQGEVAAGATAGPPGYRAHDVDVPVADRFVDHAYFVADELPRASTSQRFRFAHFDFAAFDVNAEFDRQALPEFARHGERYVAYLAHGFTPTRAVVAETPTRRTALRLTYSRRRFDLAACTENPMFPYARGARTAPPAPAKRRFLPAANLGLLDTVTSLQSLSGPRLGLVTLGDEDGGRGAALFAKLLRREGKDVRFIASVRDLAARPRFKTRADFPERAFDREVKVTAVFAEPEWVAEQLFGKVMAKKRTEVDQLIVVDVGGRALSPYWGQDRPIAVHRLMTSLRKIDNPEHPNALVILGPGYALPAASPLAHLPRTRRYVVSDADRAYLLGVDQRWSRTPAPADPALSVWLQALARDFGLQNFATVHAHDPALRVLPEHQDLLLMPINDTLDELSQIVRGI